MCLSLSLSFFGQVKSSHHADQMSQRSQVSRIALWRCCLNVFVFVIVIVIVIVIVLLARSCRLTHVSSSLWSNVSEVTNPKDCSLKVCSESICLCHYYLPWGGCCGNFRVLTIHHLALISKWKELLPTLVNLQLVTNNFVHSGSDFFLQPVCFWANRMIWLNRQVR